MCSAGVKGKPYMEIVFLDSQLVTLRSRGCFFLTVPHQWGSFKGFGRQKAARFGVSAESWHIAPAKRENKIARPTCARRSSSNASSAPSRARLSLCGSKGVVQPLDRKPKGVVQPFFSFQQNSARTPRKWLALCGCVQFVQHTNPHSARETALWFPIFSTPKG